MCLVRMVPTDRTAVNCANARMAPDVGKTTATVFATRGGWETIATMFAQRDFMENTAWNFVRVHLRNSCAMRLEGVFAVWDTTVSIV